MRQRKMRFMMVLLSLSAMVSCRGEIPVIGLDATGKAIETMISKTEYREELTKNLNALQESVVPEVDAVSGKNQFHLRSVKVGLGIKGEIGIGEFFKLGGNIGFALGFANK